MPKKPAKVTSKQVAERAGVSQTTVSFVLNRNENAGISGETRQRVLDAVRELNYVPDVSARALAKGRSSNIALILGKPHRQIFIDEYVPTILTGLNEVMQAHGYRILVQLLDEATESDIFTRLIRGKEVAGAIINLTSDSTREVEQLLPYVRARFPLVTLDAVHPEIPSVRVDKLEGTRQIVQHLVSLGHRRIACITYAPPDRRHVSERLDTYRAVLSEAGIAYDEALVQIGAYDPETGYQAMKSLLASAQFTALYAMNDVMAFGAITALHEAGLRVPQDVAVVGFDDIRLARYAVPPLTTVHEPDIEHGRRAGELLIDLINGVEPPEKHVRLATRLVVRQSCGTATASF